MDLSAFAFVCVPRTLCAAAACKGVLFDVVQERELEHVFYAMVKNLRKVIKDAFFSPLVIVYAKWGGLVKNAVKAEFSDNNFQKISFLLNVCVVYL